jgi:hypothetical protein
MVVVARACKDAGSNVPVVAATAADNAAVRMIGAADTSRSPSVR